MSWTYDITQIATSMLYQVRFEIGDTDSTLPLIQDEEISYAITLEGDVLRASARCCEVLSRQFARLADRKLGPLSITYKSQSDFFYKLAIQLRNNSIQLNTPTQKDTKYIFDKDMMNDISCHHRWGE